MFEPLKKKIVIEILLNNKIEAFFSSNEFTFLKGEKFECVSLKKFNNELLILLFGQNINKILNIEVNICGMFKQKIG